MDETSSSSGTRLVRLGSPLPEDTAMDTMAIDEGIPRIASNLNFNAPVHIDVGGTIFTSSLKTLTAYPESLLGKMFNGTIPITLDTLKQHYFIDRDGEMFKHILNFLRNKRLILPNDFTLVDMLMQEAVYFELSEMIVALQKFKVDHKKALRNENNWFDYADQFKRQTELLTQERDRLRHQVA